MKKLPLFPSYFKVIAIFTFILSFVFGIVFRDVFEGISLERVESLKELSKNMINLSLFVFLFSKRDFDDEMSLQYRYKLVANGILFVIAFIFVNVISRLVDNTINIGSNTSGLMLLLIFVNISFFQHNRKLRKELNEE